MAEPSQNQISANVQAFEGGVRAASQYPVLIVYSHELEEVPNEVRGDVIAAQFERQYPGITENLSREELDELGHYYDGRSPHASVVELGGTTYAIANTPGSFYDEVPDIVSTIAKTAPDELQDIPGDSTEWFRALGIHEGTHPGQIFDTHAEGRDAQIQTLQREADADRAVMADLESRGQTEIAQAWRDYRALAAPFDAEHATSALLDDPGEVATGAHLDAARGVESDMTAAVAQDMGIEQNEAERLFSREPRQFFETVDRLYEAGTFDDRPELKEYIEDYAGAYERRMEEMLPDEAAASQDAPQQQAPTASTPREFDAADLPQQGNASIQTGDLQDQMMIGGIPASGYFLSHADPAMAAARIDLQNQGPAAEAGLTQQQDQTLKANPMQYG